MNILLVLLTVFNFSVKTPEYAPKKNLEADFVINISTDADNELKHWTFEYQDGKRWRKAGPGLDVRKYSKNEVATLVQSFMVKRPADSIRVRISCPSSAGAKVQKGTWSSGQIAVYPAIPVKDTKKIAFVGNSFTYFYASEFIFKQIARMQGHQVMESISLKGGQTLTQHTMLERTGALWEYGPYDYVILQDQSQAPAKLAADPEANQSVLDGAATLAANFRKLSPKAEIIYENTWAYPGKSGDFGGFGSMENFDSLLEQGCSKVLELKDIDRLSPVGKGFRAAREKGINVYYRDNKHQGAYGSYLKACINYLLIYGGGFDETVDLSCGLDKATTMELRKIAQETVAAD